MGSPASLHSTCITHQSDLIHSSGHRAFKVLLNTHCRTHDGRLIGAQNGAFLISRALNSLSSIAAELLCERKASIIVPGNGCHVQLFRTLYASEHQQAGG